MTRLVEPCDNFNAHSSSSFVTKVTQDDLTSRAVWDKKSEQLANILCCTMSLVRAGENIRLVTNINEMVSDEMVNSVITKKTHYHIFEKYSF